MAAFAGVVRDGDTVLEAGGHIGYVSAYLADLVGPAGTVVVFEPAAANRSYLSRNVSDFSNVVLRAEALSDFSGQAVLYTEDLTGQNNSLLPDYSVFAENARAAGVAVKRQQEVVACVKLDDEWLAGRLAKPSLVKIDVEGAELRVMRGMLGLLGAGGVALMVEVSEQISEVYSLLKGLDYDIFHPDGRRVDVGRLGFGNWFCFSKGDTRAYEFLRRVGAADERGLG